MKPEDFDDLKQLVEFLKENKVAEFDLDRGNVKIRLKFESAAAPAVAHLLAAPAPLAVVPAVPSNTAPATPAEPAADDLHVIKSPIVGTFYGSPSPGAGPFVVPGDRVEIGQVVGIIEAMKLMNEIEADASGEIVKCLVTNGQPIEFGQPLFSVRTA